MKTHPSGTAIAGNGIAENKKAELDALTLQVLDTGYTIEQFESIVASLTEKAANYQRILIAADSARTTAYNNKILGDQVVQLALDLRDNAAIAFDEAVLANVKTTDLAGKIKTVTGKLIYASEIVNKLTNLVIRKKALNPLISDELVSLVATAGKAANNAVALTLVALQSVFTAQASSMGSEAALGLTFVQSRELYDMLTRNDATRKEDDTTATSRGESLQQLLNNVYVQAKANYDWIENALLLTTRQLNEAQAKLNKAQVKLQSLQAGLAAATAAALAS